MKHFLVLIFVFTISINSFAQEPDHEQLWKIDSVQIKKNWRTRDKIIMRELQFEPGETIDKSCIEISINQIWNIGNFAFVDYSLDSISPESYLMNIQAKDAFTLLPYLSFSGTKDDYNLGLGIEDNNFLGRNISLKLSGNVGTYGKNYNIGIEIPRQLLYKNMTIAFQALNGTGNNFRYLGDEKVSVVAFHKKQVSGSIGNPWHTDYHYTFSPNLSWNFFQHKTDKSLIETHIPFADDYELNYLALSLGESIGMINRKRHQREGYLVSAGYGVGVGLDKNSPFYQSFGLNALYYKLFNPVIEFSAGYSSGYTTSTKPSLTTYLGPGTISSFRLVKRWRELALFGYLKFWSFLILVNFGHPTFLIKVLNLFKMNKINISLLPLGKSIEVNAGTPLKDVLHEFGVEFPCGGKGTCGSCKVKLLKGELAIDAVQQQKLDKLKLSENWRLACFCKVETDIMLEISQFENIILADNSTFDFRPQTGFGMAVDLGTTTIVVQLVNLENGHVLDSVSDVNPQARFGGDLISRIQSCLDGNFVELQNLVRSKIDEMIQSILQKHPMEVSKVAIVGNTVMHHIFSGLPVNTLSFYPFHSPDLGVQEFFPKELNWELPETAKIEFFPSIGSFVGSDILAGIAATKMLESEKYSVLIDLGTNGEIVVGNSNKIICASTAAGPAFEGAKISQGMRATTGAISSINFENDELKTHVIGNVPAKGICGSGLIDILAILLNREQIGMFGEINSGDESVSLTGKVSITQQDIREFQLAKAAIAAGIQILLNQLKITYAEVDKVFIAGGFGNFLNIDNVIRTGLIECEPDRIVKLGNTALIGAKMFLFEDEAFYQKILDKTTHINLEGDPNFQDIYIDKMMLI